jgi:drug/metabolite transporter (DMT)-like permease
MFLPGLMQADGMRRVGAQRAAIGSTVGPPATILMAALFLGERLNAWQMLGSAMIVASVLVLSVVPGGKSVN